MESSSFNYIDLIKNKEILNDFDNTLTCKFCARFLFQPRECSECRKSFCSIFLKNCEVNKRDNSLCPMKCKNNIFINASKPILSIFEKILIRGFRCSNIINYN